MAHIIDGKAISAAVRGEIKDNTQALIAKTGVTPGLAVIIVGEVLPRWFMIPTFPWVAAATK